MELFSTASVIFFRVFYGEAFFSEQTQVEHPDAWRFDHVSWNVLIFFYIHLV